MSAAHRKLAAALLASGLCSISTVEAGGFWKCRDAEASRPPAACEACCRPKRHSCLCPPEAPRGEVAFALPAVAREGHALRLTEDAVERALQKAGIETAKAAELKESAAGQGTVDERLTKLEGDVGAMKNLMDRLAVAVEHLAEERSRTGEK